MLTFLPLSDLRNTWNSCKLLQKAAKHETVWNAIAERYFSHRGKGSMYLYCKSALSSLDGQRVQEIKVVRGLRARSTCSPLLEVLKEGEQSSLVVGNQGLHRVCFFSSANLEAGPKFTLSPGLRQTTSVALFRGNLLVAYEYGRVELWDRKSLECEVLSEDQHLMVFGPLETLPGCSHVLRPERQDTWRAVHLEAGCQLIATIDESGHYTVDPHVCEGECHGERSVSEALSDRLAWTFDGQTPVMAVKLSWNTLVLHAVGMKEGQVHGFDGTPLVMGGSIETLQSFNACPGAIFVTFSPRRIAKIDVKEGKIAWEVKAPSIVNRMEMATHAGKPYLVVGETDQGLHVHDLGSGQRVLNYQIPKGKSSWRAFTDRGRLRIAVAHAYNRRNAMTLRLLGPTLLPLAQRAFEPQPKRRKTGEDE